MPLKSFAESGESTREGWDRVASWSEWRFSAEDASKDACKNESWGVRNGRPAIMRQISFFTPGSHSVLSCRRVMGLQRGIVCARVCVCVHACVARECVCVLARGHACLFPRLPYQCPATLANQWPFCSTERRGAKTCSVGRGVQAAYRIPGRGTRAYCPRSVPQLGKSSLQERL